jgi:hypothetical protein
MAVTDPAACKALLCKAHAAIKGLMFPREGGHENQG